MEAELTDSKQTFCLYPVHLHLSSSLFLSISIAPHPLTYISLPISPLSLLLTNIIMAADIGTIAQLLDATLDPSQHRKGIANIRCPIPPRRCPAIF